MATTTLSSMRQSLSQNMGDFESFATTAAGSAAGTSVISTALLDLPGGGDEDAFENFYLLVADSSSDADGEFRRVANYVPNSDNPTLIVERSFSTQVASSITVELHRFSPTDKGNVIRQAIRELYPDLYLSVRDETLIVDNIVSNSGFETYSSGFTGWTEAGSPTVTEETSRVFHGSSAAKVVAGVADGQLTQALDVNLAEIAGQTVSAKFWAWTDAATQGRVRLDFGSETTSGDYHAGDSQWERLSASDGVPTDATGVTVILEAIAGSTVYWDIGYVRVGPKYSYTIPSTILRGPYTVTQQFSESDVSGPYYPIPDGGTPTEGRILRLTGMGILSQPTTDSGTTEVGEPQAQLIVAYAKMLMYRLMASPTRSAQQNRQTYIDSGRDAAGEVAILKHQMGIVMPKMGAQRHRQNWHVEVDANNRFLVFGRTRSGLFNLNVGQVAL